MPDSREDSVYLAKLAEQAERYEGMCCRVATRHICHMLISGTCRNGREHEECRVLRPGAHR